MPDPVTWEDDIKHYFTQLDVGCMRAKQPNPFDLADYEAVKRKASAILSRLKLRVNQPDSEFGMPKGGRAWPPDKIANFEAWIAAGFPKNKPDPSPPSS